MKITYLQFLNEAMWSKPIPKRKRQGKLTDEQKQKAKRRAKRAGREYPNMVDNVWASNQ
jgi:hypothetical protein